MGTSMNENLMKNPHILLISQLNRSLMISMTSTFLHRHSRKTDNDR